MAAVALLFIAALASALPLPSKDEPGGASASADDGRLGVTVSIARSTVAPGETARIDATSKVLADGSLSFPHGNHQPLGFLYLRTPAGELFVHPESGISPKSCRALEKADYARASVRKKGSVGGLMSFDVPIVNPSPEWFDPRTYEPVRPNFRAEGVYEVWLKYTIPMIQGVPADAWHGTIETKPIRFTVREIPVADRRTEPTPEQLAHLDAYMKSMDAFPPANGAKAPTVEAVEMPRHMSVENRLQRALERTENEGFARHVVALLREHQPKDAEEAYPRWWNNLKFFVERRAYLSDWRGSAVKIVGPYLDDFATVVMTELERDVRRPSQHLGGVNDARLLLDYVRYKPESPVRQRLETLARENARVPVVTSKLGDRETRFRLVTSWTILHALDILRDGMPFTDARELLGDPMRRGDRVTWNYTTGSRALERGVEGRVEMEGTLETIVFTNREEIRR